MRHGVSFSAVVDVFDLHCRLDEDSGTCHAAALGAAINKNHNEVFGLLISAGADVNAAYT